MSKNRVFLPAFAAFIVLMALAVGVYAFKKNSTRPNHDPEVKVPQAAENNTPLADVHVAEKPVAQDEAPALAPLPERKPTRLKFEPTMSDYNGVSDPFPRASKGGWVPTPVPVYYTTKNGLPRHGFSNGATMPNGSGAGHGFSQPVPHGGGAGHGFSHPISHGIGVGHGSGHRR